MIGAFLVKLVQEAEAARIGAEHAEQLEFHDFTGALRTRQQVLLEVLDWTGVRREQVDAIRKALAEEGS